MKKSYSKSKKNFLALLLSVLMVTSCAAAFSSCGESTVDSSSSSSEAEDTSTSVNDTGLIKNANFKTADTNKGLNPIVTSVTGWSRSLNSSTSGSSASSSSAQSGIINTEAKAWEDLTRLEKNVEIPVEIAKESWEDFSVNEKLAYYEYWKEQNPDDKNNIKTKLKDFYQAFNIDKDDIPTVNPGTHYAAGEEEDTNVLMIHNQASKDAGTSQKYTSSSTVTVPAGAAAEFSVWVKTAELKTVNANNEAQDAVGKGAYVRVSHSVGGKSMSDFEVKNINTAIVNPNGDNNGWVQYSFYLSASSYTDTTFTIVLGLGQGTSSERYENVNGYAFFDDIKCELVETYDQAQIEAFAADVQVGFNSTEEEKTVDAYMNDEAKKFALNFHGTFAPSSILDSFDNADVSYTTGTHKNDDSYTSAKGNKPLPALKDGIDASKDVKGVYTLSAIENQAKTNDYLSSIYNDYLVSKNEKGAWLDSNQDILLIMSAQGVAYTVDSSYEFDFYNDATGEYEDYMLVSFFVKTSNMNGATGAGITLNDGETKTSFSSIDTSSVTAVEIGENKDVYDGWQQVFFFVENDYENKAGSFTLSFNYGLTDITDATLDSFYSGFAAFTGFETYYMDENEYEAASTGTYAKKVTVSNVEEDSKYSNSGFDAATNVPTDALKEGFANLKNYSGVYSSNYQVNQPTGSFTQQDYINHTKINQYATAGLLNKDYFIGTEDNESYFNESFVLYNEMKKATGETTAEGVWNKLFGAGVSQPLVIWNKNMTKEAYGFIGGSKNIAANGTATISLRVKANNANAFVYLVDMDDDSYSSTLSIGGNLTYWYDAEGNIYTGDPAEKGSEKAFVLQSNGLYKVNDKWSKAKTLTTEQQSAYYANLTAYEKVGNDLVVAEGGAQHTYTKADANGNVIAFYGDENGNYYADQAKKVKVSNLYDLTKTSEDDESKPLAYRYLASEKKQLVAQVKDTQGEWAIVTFVVKAGATAKNYRLEVWSGARDASSVNTANDSYVMFDVNNPGDISAEEITSLIEEHKDDEKAESFETVFSYFDTDKYLRYNRDLDKDNVGNLYKASYTTAHANAVDGVAYLKYFEKYNQTVLVDYSLVDVTVEAKAIDDDADDTTSSDDGHDHDHASETNPWMLISSIAIAVVLVFAIVAIFVRKGVEKYQKKHGVKVKAPKAKKEKKVKKVKAKKSVEKQDEYSPYND